MFSEDAASAVECYGIDATVQEGETEPHNADRTPPRIVIVFGCRTVTNGMHLIIDENYLRK